MKDLQQLAASLRRQIEEREAAEADLGDRVNAAYVARTEDLRDILALLEDRAPAPSQDPWPQDPTIKSWVDHVLTDMKPKMEESAFVMQLVPKNDAGDVKFWVELGATIMMEKPLLAIQTGGAPIPPKLEQIADEVVRLPDGVNPGASEELAKAIERMNARLESEEN